MEEARKTQIMEYARTLSRNIPTNADRLLIFIVDEVVDRVMIYLNADAINPALDRIIARVVVGVYAKAKAEADQEGGSDREIKSISDNGQSVTYSDSAKNYLATAEDGDLFSGFTTILNRYREAGCGNSKNGN